MSRGLPGALPDGERILWQGAPGTFALARHAFHLRLLAGYFVAVVALGLATAGHGQPMALLLTALRCLGLAAGGCGLVALYAWAVHRTTVYTVTNRRLVLHIGVALPITLNLPFAAVSDAALHLNNDGSGDISLRLIPPQKFAYLLLWPHARPWRFAQAEPMLRAVPDAARVAQTLSRALAAAAGTPPLVAVATPAATHGDRAAPARATPHAA